jgi:zinc-ribbon domain
MEARFCTRCGTPLAAGSQFCGVCGSAVDSPGSTSSVIRNIHPPGNLHVPSRSLVVAGIVLGGMAFLFLPILFGPAAIVCGAVAVSDGNPSGWWAVSLGAAGLVIGFFLGVLVSVM